MNDTTIDLIKSCRKQDDIYYLQTDFEQIPLKEDDFKIHELLFEVNDLVFIRFIKASLLENHFDEKDEEGQYIINKFFFLPWNKEKELLNTLQKKDTRGVYSFAEDLLDYYSDDMFQTRDSVETYQNHRYREQMISLDERKNHGTSMYILYNRDKVKKADSNSYSPKNMLTFGDIDSLDTENRKEMLIYCGLSICNLISLKNHLISLGKLRKNQGIVEGGDNIYYKDPPNSHYNFYKQCEDINGVSYSNISSQFNLLDNFITLNRSQFKQRRKNSRRRS